MEKALKDLLVESLEKDTRDNSDLYVYTILDKLSKNDYIILNNYLKQHKVYYSRFKKGFISKTKIDLEAMIDFNIKVAPKQSKAAKVDYSWFLKDYTTKEKLYTFIKEVFCPNNLQGSWYIGKSESYSKDLENFINDTIADYERRDFDKIELRYIREVIIHKSLGYDIKDLRLNGNKLLYELIYNDLPIIEGLELTNERFTAMWGYDQTNVDIAQRLNKKVWGLDIFKDITSYHGYWLVRVKDNRFSDKDKVMNFSLDNNYLETFKHDASQTGYYR